ncbi:MAG TPA: TolC family protein, partial [Candidatus Saccharimonadales bacterium]|nr:TolC family protein [Candidatus Saccharimonadales bacterium]
QDRPSLLLSANQGRLYYDAFSIHSNTSATSLLLSIPIFNGFTYQYNLLKARADRDAAKENLEALRQAVTLQVWTSYFNHKTADQNVETTKDLVDSAKQSYDVASARYDAGVGTILDLLTAQSALEDARAQDVGARTSWFLTLAQLAHDTGTLMESAPAGKPDPSPEATP